MQDINLMFFAFGKKYCFDADKIEIETGIISKNLDTIYFVDVKDITAKTNIFGWGTITILERDVEHVIKYVKSTRQVQRELNEYFMQCKKEMKKVDIS